MDAAREIVAREDVPAEGTLLFTVERDEDGVEGGEGTEGEEEGVAGEAESVEGILLDLGEDVVAFENYCQHWRDVRLDTGDGASMQNGEIVCEKHGAYFESDSGYCNYGPCEGAVLAEIEVTAEDGTVYLTDDRYERPRLGPAENGDGPDDGGTAGGRIGFSGN